MKIQDVRREMSEYSALTGAEPGIPAGVVQVVLNEIGDSTGIAEIVARYIGEHDSLHGAALALARQSYPPPDGQFGVANGIDFDAWPFSRIDWDAATADLGRSLKAGMLIVVAGVHYFDVS